MEKQIINKMTPETIAMMFAMRPVMGRPFDKSKWTLFFKNDLHLKMENADTEKDFAYLNELAGEGYLDVMKYHYAGVTPCLDMSFFAKWVVEYENAKRAMRTREIVEVLREEKYDLYLKWSDSNDENKKLKAEIDELKGNYKAVLDTIYNTEDTDHDLFGDCGDVCEDIEKLKVEIDENKKLKEIIIGKSIEYRDEWMEEHHIEALMKDLADTKDENKKLKEENAVLRKSTEVYEDVMAGSNGMIQTVADLKERIETANDDYGKMRQNMRAVLNMIEYTIGGGSDMSMKIHDILWSGADTTFESDSD